MIYKYYGKKYSKKNLSTVKKAKFFIVSNQKMLLVEFVGKKAEMGIGTLIIFIALLLVAVVAAGVLLTTTGQMREKSFTTSKQTESQISSNVKVVQVVGHDGSDGDLEEFQTIYKLSPGSEPIKLSGALFTESTHNTSISLLERLGAETVNDVFSGYFSASEYPQQLRMTPFADGPPTAFYNVFGATQTSEFAIGKVAVAIIFVESNGAIDPDTENWTLAEQEAAIGHTAKGLNWWRDVEPQSGLQFTFEVYRDVPISYEPITRFTDSGNQTLWMTEALDYINAPTGASYMDRLRTFDDNLRKEKNSNWAFTLFVVDSSNTPGGGFPDGYGGIAYLNGPHTFIGASASAPNQAMVYAHEFGHIFGARDQYAGCGCADVGGYYNIATGNCITGCTTNTTSIMRSGAQMFQSYNNGIVDAFALAQMGLIDSDKNSYLDPIDHLFETGDTQLTDALATTLAQNNYSTTNNNVGYFAYEYLQRGTNSKDGHLKQGDIIRMYHQNARLVVEAEQVRMNFIPKTGTATATIINVPEVMSTRQVGLYPSR